jgi:hypothetical protein
MKRRECCIESFEGRKIVTTRVCLKSMDAQSERLRFDLVLGDDAVPLQDIMYFGFRGAFGDAVDASAVLLNPEGIIDLGPYYEEASRRHRTNLLQRMMRVGEYVTVWWKFGGWEEATTYVIESMTDLAALRRRTDLATATVCWVPKLDTLPQFRARVRESFDIEGFDDVVYRPPVGVEGYAGILQDVLYFCPDEAFDKAGRQIIAPAEPEWLELITDDDVD